LVGRVTPCAPRLQRAVAKYPRRRIPDPLSIKSLLNFPVPTSAFGLKKSFFVKKRLGNAPMHDIIASAV
jgi:hypothetical protein